MEKLILILLTLTLQACQCIFAQSSKNDVNQRIVGGTSAKITQVPWQVSLQYLNTTTGRYFHGCGGTIITESLIATAAHCMDGVVIPQFRVRAGVTDWTDSISGQTRGIKSFRSHPEYKKPANGNWAVNDVAVIRLRTPLTLNKRAKVMTLPPRGTTFSGTAAISGWGYDKPLTILELQQVHNIPDNQFPKKLNLAFVQILPLKQCNEEAQAIAISLGITNFKPFPSTNICTINRQTNAGVCYRDSGGPLICGKENGDIFLCGITSFGFGCGQEKLPTVFTNVAKYTDWIVDAAIKLLFAP